MTMQELEPHTSSQAESFAIGPRKLTASSSPRSVRESPQQTDLWRLAKMHPGLDAVRAYVEAEPLFESNSGRVLVIQEYHYDGFMRGRIGALQGVAIVAQGRLVRRFDREELGLPHHEGSSEAVDRHLAFWVSPAPAAA